MTLAKFGGVCRRCKKQPIEFRKQWIFLALLAIAAPIAAILIDQELAELEAKGETKRVHILIAMMYQIAGRLGVAMLFGFVGLICAVLGYRSFRNVRLAKLNLHQTMIDSIEAKDNDD